MWKDQLRVNPLFASLVLGHVAAYGMGPIYAWPLLIVCLSLYWIALTSLSTEKPWKSWLSGFLFGFGFFVSSLWWIGNALLVGGNEFRWAYPFAVSGLPFIFALYPMLACGLTRVFAKGRSLKSFLIFISLMFLAELGRGILFTGFPWNLFGMTWTNTLEMMQILSIGGVYSLSALTLFMALAPAFVWKGAESKTTRFTMGVLAISCAVGLYTYGHQRLQANPTTFNTDVIVQMIQPNIAQEDKWNGDKRWDNFRDTIRLIEPIDVWKKAKTRVVVMPETTLTYQDFQVDQAMHALRGKLSGFSEQHIYLLSGALLRSENGYHNSLVVLDKNAEFLESFDKFHLVPFGEYIPFQKYIPLGPLVAFSGFVEGDGPHTLQHDNLPPFSPLVCYEMIFPAAVVNDAEPRPEWMVNVTNDAWYGVSPGPFQHLGQAQYRAIEEGLPMVRVAQTGISAVIDPYGRIITAAGLNQLGSIESELPRATPEPTVFSRMF